MGCVAGAIRGVEPGTTWVERHQLAIQALSQQGTLQHPFLPYAQTANAFYRRAVWSDLGGFAERWVSGGDADLAWRMQQETPFVLVSAPTAVVRHRHRRSVSGLCRQAYRHGVGHAALRQRYGGEVEGFSLATTSGAVGAGFGRGDRSWLDLLHLASRSAGLAAATLAPGRTRVRDAR